MSDEDKKILGSEGSLFLCNCKDDSSHIDMNWHYTWCKYWQWCYDNLVNVPRKADEDD